MSLYGLFDDDVLGGLKKQSSIRVPPPTPETGWRPPQAFPNLASAVAISIDVETKEPDFDHGPGWGRKKGHIVGFSVGALDALGNIGRWYFPVRHEVEPEYNLDPDTCFRWLKTILETPHIPKIGANLIYDVGWLTTENIFIQGDLHDVQFAEALLNEEGTVALDYLAQKYTGAGKETSILYEWCATAYGGDVNGKQRANIWRASPRIVGLYGEADAALPLEIIQKQWPMLHAEGLMDVYRMECDSIVLLVKMRLTGVAVDLNAAEQLYGELGGDIHRLNEQLYTQTGVRANVNSSAELAKVFDAVGLSYPHTDAGNPSFKKEFLQGVDHPVGQTIREIREHEKIRGTFIRSYLLESNVDGRIHCSFHPLRGDEGGTRSGRFSSDSPNLQNIPVRTELGKRVRKLFVPDAGHIAWEKNDYSQIEYRFLAHFAVGPGSDNLREEYNANPRTDYHDNTYYRLCPFMGWNPENKDTAKLYRKPVKNINFGLLYGMGKDKLSRALMEYFQGKLGKSQINELFDAYHSANPYVKATMEETGNFAKEHGFIQTILNRRSRFNAWEPRQINHQNRARSLPYELALRNYGADIQRSETHKAINRKLQGSAADMIKRGMHRCYKEGVFDVIGVPKLQVHDELDFSVIDDSPQQKEAYRYMRYVLENAIQLRVPVLVDSGRGPNWGVVD